MAMYSILYLVPSMAHESRFAVGALVHDGAKVQFIQAQRLPCADCLGGRDEALLLQTILERAGMLGNLEDREAKRLLGQHALLGPVRELSPGALDPFKWVRHHILPHAGEQRPVASGAKHRATVAREILGRMQLSVYLQQGKFQPEHYWPGASEKVPHIKPVHHWVSGGHRSVLLMEPAFVEATDQGLVDVSQRILAYSRLFELLAADTAGSDLIAFVAASGASDRRKHVVSELRKTRVDVYDLADKDEAAELARRVRTTHQIVA